MVIMQLKLREADRIIERNHIKHIIFDFSGANFMDSGIGVIMGRYKSNLYRRKDCCGKC